MNALVKLFRLSESSLTNHSLIARSWHGMVVTAIFLLSCLSHGQSTDSGVALLETKIAEAVSRTLVLAQPQVAGLIAPRQAQLLNVTLKLNQLTLNFSSELLDTRIGSLEFEQVMRRVHFAASEALGEKYRNIEFSTLIEGVPLPELFREMEQAADGKATITEMGAPNVNLISGRRIVISPGHGYYYTGTAWSLQRSYFFGIVEDFVNSDITAYLNTALVAAGADSRPTRNFNKSAGNGESGFPKWQEAARYHLKAIGVDSTIWNEAGYTQYDQDIRCRPRYANSVAGDILVSVHNNGGGGTGTETWYDTSNGYQVESKKLADFVHARIINAIRGSYNSSWTDRGVKGGDGTYGENRIATRPSVLIEVAFMDRQTPDNAALQNETFKSLVATAIKNGIDDYFGGTVNPPTAPTANAASSETSSSFSANWSSASSATGYWLDVSTSSSFSSYVSGYNNLDVGNVTSRSVSGLSANTTYYYRVRAYNSGGTSGNSGIIGVTTTGTAPANDACANAVAMTAGSTYSVNTANATSAGDPTPSCQSSFGKGVWYAFTPSSSGLVTISTCSSDFDTVVQVYTGSCGSLTPVSGGCNDDDGVSCTGDRASISFSGAAGTTYRILAGGFNGGSGNLSIVATVTPQLPDLTVTSSVTAPSQAAADSTINVSYTLKNIGDVTSGSFSVRVALGTTAYGTQIPLADFSTTSLTKDESRPETRNVTIPTSVTAGSYWVTVFADGPAPGVITESREDNNIGSTTPNQILITAAPPTVAAPTIAPTGGNFSGSVQVTLACTTSGATIRYTTDGSTPTTGSPAYIAPFTLTSSATVKAKAFASGYNDSSVASASFTVAPVQTVATPTITPTGGSYSGSVQVTLACTTAGATIRYTTDGNDPAGSSPIYTAQFTLTSSATVKAKAFASGYSDSAIAAASFTVTSTPSYTLTVNANNGTVTKNPNQASYTSGSQVILTATPANGYQFSSWTGSASGSANPLPVTMDGDKTITANFITVTTTQSPYDAKWAVPLNTLSVYASAPAQGGGLVLFGTFTGTITAGGQSLTASGSPSDFYGVKLNASNQVVWVKQFGGANEESVESCVQHPAGGWAIAGTFRNTGNIGGVSLVSSGNRDTYLARLDEDGNVLWAKRGGGTGIDYGRNAGVDGVGNCFLFGLFTTSATFTGGGVTLNATGTRFDIFVAKYSSTGDFLWAKSGGGPEYDDLYCAKVDAAGNAYVGGIFEKQTTFGSYTLNGVGSPTDWDSFLAKFAPNGDVLWAKRFGQSAGDTASESMNFIAPAADGTCFFGGMYQVAMLVDGQALPSQTSWTAFVGKMNSGGTVEWLRAIPAEIIIELGVYSSFSSAERGLAISDGGLIVIGRYRGKLAFGSTTSTNASNQEYLFLSKLDGAGTAQWVISSDSPGFSYVNNVAPASGDRIRMTARFSQPVGLPGIPTVNATAEEAVLVEFGPPEIVIPPIISMSLAGDKIVLVWPATATGFVLEWATNLPPAGWTLNSATPTVVGGSLTVTNPISSGAKFYRLKK